MNNVSIIHDLDVFISYSSKNEIISGEIEKALLYRKVKCWKANSQSISGGEDFRKNIVTAISNAKIILFILSEDSLNSNWVKAELTEALLRNKKIYTIKLKNVLLDELTEFKLGCSQITELYEDIEATIEGIAINIQNEKNEIFRHEEELIKKDNRNIKLINLNLVVEITSIIYIILMTIVFFSYSAKNIYNFSNSRFIQSIIAVGIYLLKLIIHFISIAVIKLIYNSVIRHYVSLECGAAEYLQYKQKYKKTSKDIELLRRAAHHNSRKAYKELIKLYSMGTYVEKDLEISKEYEERLDQLKQKKIKTNFNQFMYNVKVIIFLVSYFFFTILCIFI